MNPSLLPRLWLSEPDPDLLREATDAGFPKSSVDDLAVAYADLFLLNVYPYGSVFTDPSGELSGPYAAWMEQHYLAAGHAATGLEHVAAADHVGLCLDALAHLSRARTRDLDLVTSLQAWIPVLTLAVEREPGAHPFYRELARRTRTELLSEAGSPQSTADPAELGLLFEPSEEVHLSDVIRFLLAPARCGFFLSRARMGHLGRAAGARVPFGSRFDVARGLFERAGENGTVDDLMDSLEEERIEWSRVYDELARSAPSWMSHAVKWKARLERTGEALATMRGIVQSPPEWEYQERES